jgi:hypothetical protein
VLVSDIPKGMKIAFGANSEVDGDSDNGKHKTSSQ